jgi:hypothetical protein
LVQWINEVDQDGNGVLVAKKIRWWKGCTSYMNISIYIYIWICIYIYIYRWTWMGLDLVMFILLFRFWPWRTEYGEVWHWYGTGR